jgi:hypothetical protein
MVSRRLFFGSLLGGTAVTGVTVDASRQPETIQAGDLFVIEHPGHLNEVELRNIEESAKRMLPEGVRRIVLEEGMHARLLRPQGDDPISVRVDGRRVGESLLRQLRDPRLA